MKRFFQGLSHSTVFLLMLISTTVSACLPSISIPAGFTKCKVDADCVVAGDGCRSCTKDLWIVNQKSKPLLEEIDLKARVAAKCVRSCEACSTQWAKPVCRSGLCKNSAQRPF